MQAITDTLKAYGSAISLASRYNLYPYLLISGLISFIIGGAIFGSAWLWSDNLSNVLLDLYPFEWGIGFIEKIVYYLSWSLILVIGGLLYKYIVLIAIAPVMSPLSERLEEGMVDAYDGVDFSYTRMISEIMRGIRLALRNITYELSITLVLLLLSLIPGLAIITTPLIFIVQAYYMGFANIDFCLERHFTVRESVRWVTKRKILAIANGSLFLLLLMIPVVGLFIAPFLGTIAATKVSVDRLYD